MKTSYNLRGFGTHKDNWKGSASDLLPKNKNFEWGNYKRFMNKRLGMVTTRRLDSTIIQLFSTVTESGIGKVKKDRIQN